MIIMMMLMLMVTTMMMTIMIDIDENFQPRLTSIIMRKWMSANLGDYPDLIEEMAFLRMIMMKMTRRACFG